jgi:hypothetical protein
MPATRKIRLRRNRVEVVIFTTRGDRLRLATSDEAYPTLAEIVTTLEKAKDLVQKVIKATEAGK